MERLKALLRNWLDHLRGGRSGPPTFDDLRVFGELAREMRRAIEKAFPEVLTVEKLGYEDALGWFQKHRPDDARIRKGALLRAANGTRGWTVTQVFLDGSSSLVLRPDGAPWGRRIEALSFDAELDDLFDGEDLVVVE